MFATLRGPFFAIGDEALLIFRQQVGDNGDLKAGPQSGAHDRSRDVNPAAIEVADALDALRLLHVGRNIGR